MIKVTVELCPFGYDSPDGNTTLSTIIIGNDGSGDRNTGNYRYYFYRRGSDYKNAKPYKTGTVKNFPRIRKNVNHLLKLVLNDALGGK